MIVKAMIELDWPTVFVPSPVTVSVAFGPPSCVKACCTVRPVAVVPSPKSQSQFAALASVALKVTTWFMGASQRPLVVDRVAPEIV